MLLQILMTCHTWNKIRLQSPAAWWIQSSPTSWYDTPALSLQLATRRISHNDMKQTSNLSKAHVTRDSSGPAILAISVGPSPTISAQFSLKMCAAVEIAKNSLKTPILGHSRSSTLTPIKSLSPVLVLISSMSASICNCFHSKAVK